MSFYNGDYDPKLIKALMLLLAALTFLLCCTGPATSASTSVVLTRTQIATLQTAHEIGSKIEIDGERFPQTAMMLAWETCGGEFGKNDLGVIVGDSKLGFKDRAYGKWQVRLTAYNAVAKAFPNLVRYDNEEEVIIALLLDDRYSCTIAMHYFRLMYERFDDWKLALIAYNGGPSAATGDINPKYYNKLMEVKRHIIEPYWRGEYTEVNRES